MVSRESLVDVFGDEIVILPVGAVPERLRRLPAGRILIDTGLPKNLLDAISTVPGLAEGIKTYGEHCADVGMQSDERTHAMYRVGFAGGSILIEPGTGAVYYADPEAVSPVRINTSVDKYVNSLCVLEKERERFDFLDEEDLVIQRKEISDLLRESDREAWGTASTFWRWIIEQISADDYRVF